MAYLAQNPQDEEKNINSQVLVGGSGSNVQQQGQQAPVGGTQSATIEGNQGNSSQPSTNAKKPSSGQFTNLKNYLQANQGAGQKIGQQLTGGMQKQAEQIGNAVNQQKQQYQSQVQQQEAQRKLADQQAQKTLQKAQNLSAQAGLSQQEIADYKALTSGQKTFQDVQDMNLTPQQVQQQQLAQQAENLKTFEGRQGQLRENFGKQRQYGQGMASLDNLLLQKQGLPQVLDQAKSFTEGTKSNIEGAKQFSREQLGKLIADNQAFAKGLQTKAETGQTGVISALDQLQQKTAAQRLNELNTQFNPFLTAEQKELADLEKYYAGEAVRQRLVDSTKQSLGNQFASTTNREVQLAAENLAKGKILSFEDYKKQNPPRNIDEAHRLQSNYSRYYQNTLNNEMADIRQKLGDPGQAEQLRNQLLQQYVQTGQGTPRIGTNWQANWDPRVLSALNQTMTGNNSQVDANTLKNLGVSQKDIDDVFNKVEGKYISTQLLNDLVGKLGSGIQSQKAALPKALSDELKKATGYGFEDYTQGKDLSRESLATDADRARYSALSSLAGKEAKDLQLSKPGNARAATALTEGQMKELLAKLSSSYGRSNLNSVPSKAGAPLGVASLGNQKVNIG